MLAAMALYILLSFNAVASNVVSIAVLATIGYWLVFRRKVGRTLCRFNYEVWLVRKRRKKEAVHQPSPIR